MRNRFSVTFNHFLNRANEEEINKLLSFPWNLAYVIHMNLFYA